MVSQKSVVENESFEDEIKTNTFQKCNREIEYISEPDLDSSHDEYQNYAPSPTQRFLINIVHRENRCSLSYQL